MPVDQSLSPSLLSFFLIIIKFLFFIHHHSSHSNYLLSYLCLSLLLLSIVLHIFSCYLFLTPSAQLCHMLTQNLSGVLFLTFDIFLFSFLLAFYPILSPPPSPPSSTQSLLLYIPCHNFPCYPPPHPDFPPSPPGVSTIKLAMKGKWGNMTVGCTQAYAQQYCSQIRNLLLGLS